MPLYGKIWALFQNLQKKICKLKSTRLSKKPFKVFPCKRGINRLANTIGIIELNLVKTICHLLANPLSCINNNLLKVWYI